jgi:hypothetical protein
MKATKECILKACYEPSDLLFDLLPISIKEGMKIFFSGYPLTQPVITFHKGHIFSIFTKGNTPTKWQKNKRFILKRRKPVINNRFSSLQDKTITTTATCSYQGYWDKILFQ